MGGFPTKGAYFQPRVGVAYALGNSTVLRGGWGRYYYHSGQFTTGLNVSAGMQTINLSNNQGTGGNTPLLASELDTLNVNGSALSIGGVDRKDDRSPYTDSYSFTISQRVPGSGLLEVAYVGNRAATCSTRAEWAATSTWCRWAPCSPRRTAAWTRTA